jgi:DNA-directed RNA polymerase subunit F
MDEFKSITDNLKKSLEKLVDLNERTLAKIAKEHPTEVDQMLRDQKATIDAIQSKDINKITELFTKYADISNK